MKTKKYISGVAAAVAMLGLSGVANAEHDPTSCATSLSNEMKNYAYRLACDSSLKDLGYVTDVAITSWPSANPLWQRQAGKYKGDSPEDVAKRDELGCEVHEKLVTKLYTPRPQVDDGQGGTKNVPPPKSNKKGSNDAQGAGNALQIDNLKFETAIFALQSFKETVDASVPNEESINFPSLPSDAGGLLTDEQVANPKQGDWETYLKWWADDAIYRIAECGHVDLTLL